jgi:hypothetical protein
MVVSKMLMFIGLPTSERLNAATDQIPPGMGKPNGLLSLTD